MPRPAKNDEHLADDYRHYVEHPRFGRKPRLTGLNPTRVSTGVADVAPWHSPRRERIPMTAVAADMSKQHPATFQVAYYFDVRRVCRDCGRKFIFFAEEQKYWYEDLGFKLDADCVQCFPCRHVQHRVDVRRERYNELIALDEPGPDECMELASVSVDLIESGAFTTHAGTIARTRMWLNRVAGTPEFREACEELRARLSKLEGRG